MKATQKSTNKLFCLRTKAVLNVAWLDMTRAKTAACGKIRPVLTHASLTFQELRSARKGEYSDPSCFHRILGWKGLQGSFGPTFHGKSTVSTRWPSTLSSRTIKCRMLGNPPPPWADYSNG